MTRAAAVGTLAVAAFTVPWAARAQAPQPLKASIEAFYAYPSLIGSAPRSPAWSPDSRRVAFIWSNEGANCGDVWVVDAGVGAPVRIARSPHPHVAAPVSKVYAEQRAAIAAELDRCVSSVVWKSDGTRVLLTFQGDIFARHAGPRVF